MKLLKTTLLADAHKFSKANNNSLAFGNVCPPANAGSGGWRWIFILSIFSILPSFAQDDTTKFFEPGKMAKNFNTWSATLNFGSLLFYGDIRQYDWYPVMEYQNEWKWGGGFTLNKTFSPVFALQGNLLYGKLAGTKRGIPDDTTKPGENLYKNGVYFNAQIFEYSIYTNINLSNLFFPNKQNRKFYTYAVAGIGFVNFRTIARSLWTDKWKFSYGYSVDGKKSGKATTETVFPLGFGIKTKLSPKIDIGLQATIHNVNTEKLDALDTVIRPAKDKYGYTSLNLTYRFGKKDKSLEWITPLEATNLDSDEDGVPDIIDKEPNTPAGAVVDGSGIALDSDADGIPDINDLQPNTLRGAKVNAQGVGVDSDADGVPDGIDKEPNTTKGTLVNFQGIGLPLPGTGIDDDGDGIPNTIDKEPNTPKGTPVNLQGISISSTMFADSLLSMILPSVYFEINSTKIDLANYKNIAPVAKLMLLYPAMKIEVIGYADQTGLSAFNRELSKRRAEAVLDVLHNTYGIPKDRLYINFFGDTKPLAKDVQPINRRVDFMIIK